MMNDIEILIKNEVLGWPPFIATAVLRSIVATFSEDEVNEMIECLNFFMENDGYKYQFSLVPPEINSCSQYED